MKIFEMNEQAVTLLMENGPGDSDVKAFIMQDENDFPPRIIIAYQVTNMDGEEIDAGIEGPEGGVMLVQPTDGGPLGDVTPVNLAIALLRDYNANEPSTRFFHRGMWYIADDDTDYRTGEVTSRSFHPRGFTPKEEEEIFKAITGRK